MITRNFITTLLLVALQAQLPDVATASESPAWARIQDGSSAQKEGSILELDAKGNRLLVVGQGVASYDLSSKTWSSLTKKVPEKRGIHPYYQHAYDAPSKTIYCLSGSSTLYAFNTESGVWAQTSKIPELAGLSWPTMAYDPEGRKLVVVGSDKKLDNLGWTRTALFDIASGKWSTLAEPGDQIVAKHKQRIEALGATTDWIGRIRLAWYRDPKGEGQEAERAELLKRWAALKAHPGCADVASELDPIEALLKEKKTLDALKAARAFQRRLEEAAYAQYPVPRSRRNAPVAYHPQQKKFILFGGDHEDYLMNDTWVLDLKTGWTCLSPEKAPGPRGGHALFYLPKSKRIALYGGYIQSSSTSYGARPWYTINPRQLWVFELGAEGGRWNLAASWPAKKGSLLPPPGFFYGYSAQTYSTPEIVADDEDRLLLAAPGSKNAKPSLWSLALDVSKVDTANEEKLGVKPGQRQYRTNSWVASFCEVDTPPKPTNLDSLPPNRWVRMPNPPRNPCQGRRQRDWGTSVWDADRSQILLWGGGHCVQSSSPVAHYSPLSGRTVEGYDADEPYGRNGGGGYGSSLWNRPWISVHNYNHYAYDPVCKLMVTARGSLYDPVKMDWIREKPLPTPFHVSWSKTLLEATPHGTVAWAQSRKGQSFGLWLFDREKGWTNLQPKGQLRSVYCDSEGAVYDSKRDRLVMGFGGGYGKSGDGTMTAFDFKTKQVEVLTPSNQKLGIMYNTREMAYIPEADLILFGSGAKRVGDKKTGRNLTLVYHCGENKYHLLDAGSVAYGNSAGWMYDQERKNVYVFTNRGECWAMKVDPSTLKLLDELPVVETKKSK